MALSNKPPPSLGAGALGSAISSSLRALGRSATSLLSGESLPVDLNDPKRDRVISVTFGTMLWEGQDRMLVMLAYTNGFQIWDVEEENATRELVSRRGGPVHGLTLLPAPVSSETTAAATGVYCPPDTTTSASASTSTSAPHLLAGEHPLVAVFGPEFPTDTREPHHHHHHHHQQQRQRRTSSEGPEGRGGEGPGEGLEQAAEEEEDQGDASIVRLYSLRSNAVVHSLRFRTRVLSVRASATLLAVQLTSQVFFFRSGSMCQVFNLVTFPFCPPPGSSPALLAPLALGARWLAYAADHCPDIPPDHHPPPLSAEGIRDGVVGIVSRPSAAAFSATSNSLATLQHLTRHGSRAIASTLTKVGEQGYKAVSEYYSQYRSGSGEEGPQGPRLEDGGWDQADWEARTRRMRADVRGEFGAEEKEARGSRHEGAHEQPEHVTPTHQQPQLGNPENAGVVMVRSTETREVLAHFRAHKSPLLGLTFDPSGRLLATASAVGNYLNVFLLTPRPASTSSGSCAANSCAVPSTQAVQHLYRLRRGVTSALLHSLTFSPDSAFLAASSAKGTSHVYPILPLGGPPSVHTHTASSTASQDHWAAAASASSASSASHSQAGGLRGVGLGGGGFGGGGGGVTGGGDLLVDPSSSSSSSCCIPGGDVKGARLKMKPITAPELVEMHSAYGRVKTSPSTNWSGGVVKVARVTGIMAQDQTPEVPPQAMVVGAMFRSFPPSSDSSSAGGVGMLEAGGVGGGHSLASQAPPLPTGYSLDILMAGGHLTRFAVQPWVESIPPTDPHLPPQEVLRVRLEAKQRWDILRRTSHPDKEENLLDLLPPNPTTTSPSPHSHSSHSHSSHSSHSHFSHAPPHESHPRLSQRPHPAVAAGGGVGETGCEGEGLLTQGVAHEGMQDIGYISPRWLAQAEISINPPDPNPLWTAPAFQYQVLVGGGEGEGIHADEDMEDLLNVLEVERVAVRRVELRRMDTVPAMSHLAHSHLHRPQGALLLPPVTQWEGNLGYGMQHPYFEQTPPPLERKRSQTLFSEGSQTDDLPNYTTTTTTKTLTEPLTYPNPPTSSVSLSSDATNPASAFPQPPMSHKPLSSTNPISMVPQPPASHASISSTAADSSNTTNSVAPSPQPHVAVASEPDFLLNPSAPNIPKAAFPAAVSHTTSQSTAPSMVTVSSSNDLYPFPMAGLSVENSSESLPFSQTNTNEFENMFSNSPSSPTPAISSDPFLQAPFVHETEAGSSGGADYTEKTHEMHFKKDDLSITHNVQEDKVADGDLSSEDPKVITSETIPMVNLVEDCGLNNMLVDISPEGTVNPSQFAQQAVSGSINPQEDIDALWTALSGKAEFSCLEPPSVEKLSSPPKVVPHGNILNTYTAYGTPPSRDILTRRSSEDGGSTQYSDADSAEVTWGMDHLHFNDERKTGRFLEERRNGEMNVHPMAMRSLDREIMDTVQRNNIALFGSERGQSASEGHQHHVSQHPSRTTDDHATFCTEEDNTEEHDELSPRDTSEEHLRGREGRGQRGRSSTESEESMSGVERGTRRVPRHEEVLGRAGLASLTDVLDSGGSLGRVGRGDSRRGRHRRRRSSSSEDEHESEDDEAGNSPR